MYGDQRQTPDTRSGGGGRAGARHGGALPLRVRGPARSVHRPRPVPLHPRGPDVPLQLRAHAGAERHAGHRPLRPAQPQPDRRADAAAQQEAARQGGHALADLRAAEEDRAVAARAGRGHRRLRAGRGGRRGRPGRDALHRQADRHRQRHRAGHQAGGHHHLQRPGTARQRHPHRIARPGSGHQVPHRRRAALRHAAHRQGLALHHHFAHQGDERAGYRREARPAGRPFPRALQEPPDRFPRLHHAHHPRRGRRAPRARQGIDEREVRQALARRGGLLATATWSSSAATSRSRTAWCWSPGPPARARPPRSTPR